MKNLIIDFPIEIRIIIYTTNPTENLSEKSDNKLKRTIIPKWQCGKVGVSGHTEIEKVVSTDLEVHMTISEDRIMV